MSETEKLLRIVNKRCPEENKSIREWMNEQMRLRSFMVLLCDVYWAWMDFYLNLSEIEIGFCRNSYQKQLVEMNDRIFAELPKNQVNRNAPLLKKVNSVTISLQIIFQFSSVWIPLNHFQLLLKPRRIKSDIKPQNNIKPRTAMDRESHSTLIRWLACNLLC